MEPAFTALLKRGERGDTLYLCRGCRFLLAYTPNSGIQADVLFLAGGGGQDPWEYARSPDQVFRPSRRPRDIFGTGEHRGTRQRRWRELAPVEDQTTRHNAEVDASGIPFVRVMCRKCGGVNRIDGHLTAWTGMNAKEREHRRRVAGRIDRD